MSVLFRPFTARPLRLTASVGLGMLGVSLVAGGCSRRESTGDHVTETAIEQLRSGETIRRMNGDRAASETTVPSASDSNGNEKGGPPSPLDGSCPGIPPLIGDSSEEEDRASLQQLGSCMRRVMTEANRLSAGMEFLRSYATSAVDRPFSRMRADEIEAYVKANAVDPIQMLKWTMEGPEAMAKIPRRSRLRSVFRDQELKELQALAARRRQAMLDAQGAIFSMVDAQRARIERWAAKVDRWAVLLALRDSSPRTIEKSIRKALQGSGVAVPALQGESEEFFSLLYPYALQAVVPDPGREGDPLHPRENPFDVVMTFVAQLGGPAETAREQARLYAEIRDADNPPIPSHEPPAADAVRVAVIDSGVDFIRYPELGAFLSGGREDGQGSADYADGDGNPFARAQGDAAHGSHVTATILSTLAHHAPEALRERRIDLSVWKAWSTRNFLAYPYTTHSTWENRYGPQEPILSQARAATPGANPPRILSVSMTFPMRTVLEKTGARDAVIRAPWLWVMAAGNGGKELPAEGVPACLGDLPANQRNDARILCVGALRKGILEDWITRYSNRGEGVDVYAYESYIDLCPNGTSCSTPAVSGAVAALAARYPSASPEFLKQVVIEASEERALRIDPTGAIPSERLAVSNVLASLTLPISPGANDWAGETLASGYHRVRVFDPGTMMERLWQVAAAKTGR